MNLRPPGYEPDELPSCSTPRHSVAFIGDIDYYTLFQQFCQEGAESFFAAEAEGENAAADLLSRKPAATPIHAPPRGATKRGVGNEAPARFQFTPLREGRPDGMLRRAGWAHFNSRPSARGDANLCAMAALRDISIHAPPRGATGQNAEERRGTYFNSRPSARGDRAIPGEGQHVVISIHAPPRGATETGYAKLKLSTFQFTPLREGRLACFKQSDNIILFQFTPLREGRPNPIAIFWFPGNFNSRPSARGDSSTTSVTYFRSYFNSRPSARGDRRSARNAAQNILFQFTPLREGRHNGRID